MKIRILATGSSGNSVLVDHQILIDAGITKKAFQSFGIDPKTISLLAITHRHSDHMNLPFVRYLLEEGVSMLLPAEAIADIAREGKADTKVLCATGQIKKIVPEEETVVGGIRLIPYAQKHHDIINYAFVLEKAEERLLYSTDLDTVEATDVGVGLLHLGQFDTLLLEGNYDEAYLRSYIEHMVSVVPGAEDPRKQNDLDLEQWVKANYRNLPEEVARNAFRAIQNHRHLSKQQARAYAATHVKPGGRYYEIHRSKTFYEAPEGWAF